MRRQRKVAAKGRRHDSTAGGKNRRAMQKWRRVKEIHGIGCGDESACGTRIKDYVRWWIGSCWAIYEREWRIIWL
jgi:hypothetical protein